MAAVEVTITGVLYDKLARTTRPVVLIGDATLTGLGVGGGPMPPGEGSPPGIWGPTDPRPGYGLPGQPPGIWGGPIDPRPDHGLPGQPPGTWGGAGEPFPGYGLPPVGPPPEGPPGDDGFIKSPPEGGGWGFHPTYGWMLDPKAGGPK